jgi:hypothetical protein
MIKNLFFRLFTIGHLKRLEIQVYLSKMYFNGLDFSLKILEEKTYFQIYIDLCFLVIDIDFSRRCHHHGARIYLTLFTLHFEGSLYDTRHWDDELGEYSKD